MILFGRIATGFLLLLFFFPAFAKAQWQPVNNISDSLQHYNRWLSPQEMEEDLRVFLDIRKEVNSGLYTYRSKQQIDSIFHWAIVQVKKPMRIIDFYKIILRLTDFEGSCHNYTEPDLALMNFLRRQRSYFPYALKYIEGQIIFDARLAEIPTGARIVSLNGTPAKELMHSFYKYYRTDGYVKTYKWSASVNRSFDVNYFLEYGFSDTFVVQYLVPGSSTIQEVAIPAVSLSERKKNEAQRYSAPVTSTIDFKTQSPYSFRLLSPSVGLLNLRWFGMVRGKEDPAFAVYCHFIDSVFIELSLRKVANLIIDVRNNPGGADPAFEQPVRYLTRQTFKENRVAYISFDPDCFPFRQYFWGLEMSAPMDSSAFEMGISMLKARFPIYRNGKSLQNTKYNPEYGPKYPQFEGNVFMLINENVASAGSHFASLMKAFVKNLTIVGVETCGGYYIHNGHSPLIYELPNSKIKTQFSIVHVIQDAPEMESQPIGRGIIPDYEVWPSIDDFMKQEDTQLNFALGLIYRQ